MKGITSVVVVIGFDGHGLSRFGPGCFAKNRERATRTWDAWPEQRSHAQRHFLTDEVNTGALRNIRAVPDACRIPWWRSHAAGYLLPQVPNDGPAPTPSLWGQYRQFHTRCARAPTHWVHYPRHRIATTPTLRAVGFLSPVVPG